MLTAVHDKESTGGQGKYGYRESWVAQRLAHCACLSPLKTLTLAKPTLNGLHLSSVGDLCELSSPVPRVFPLVLRFPPSLKSTQSEPRASIDITKVTLKERPCMRATELSVSIIQSCINYPLKIKSITFHSLTSDAGLPDHSNE